MNDKKQIDLMRYLLDQMCDIIERQDEEIVDLKRELDEHQRTD